MAAIKLHADVGQRQVGVLSGQQESRVAGQDVLALARLGLELVGRKAVDVADVAHDVVQADRGLGHVVMTQHVPGQVHGNAAIEELGLEHEILQAALQLAHVRGQLVGQKRGHFLGQQHLMHGGLAGQDAAAHVQVGLVDDGQKARVDARQELAVQARKLLGQKGAGKDQTAAPGVEGFQGIEQFVLDARLVPEEMDVFQQKDVDVFPEGGLELLHLLGLYGHDQTVGELLGREIGDPGLTSGLAAEDAASHGLDEVGLAQARSRADKKLLRRQGQIADALACGVGHLVGRADHELVVAEAEPVGQSRRSAGGHGQGQGRGHGPRAGGALSWLATGAAGSGRGQASRGGDRGGGPGGLDHKHLGTRAHGHGGGLGNGIGQSFAHPGGHKGVGSDKFQRAITGPGREGLDPEVEQSGAQGLFEQLFGL